jgi:transcriptional repressor NrdR
MDSRSSEDGSAIRRRRQCPQCGSRFSTTETASLIVIKRNGATEPFSRDKIVNGVRKACQGRPVTDGDLMLLAQAVEEAVRGTGVAQIEANDVGLAILEPLRKLDEVAFMRFASVYQGWESLDDFETAIQLLRLEHSNQEEQAGS